MPQWNKQRRKRREERTHREAKHKASAHTKGKPPTSDPVLKIKKKKPSNRSKEVQARMGKRITL